ncbi:hypothetical protein [Haliscomenobacter sp.]|uniref:hypothetical protein n=1 Tax=Haliscomenobacter sp. TaxID=2717303 RepID=UPI0035936E16
MLRYIVCLCTLFFLKITFSAIKRFKAEGYDAIKLTFMIAGVFKGGKWYEKASLEKMLEEAKRVGE